MSDIIQHVLVVDFNHARGPEIEFQYPPVAELSQTEAWNILPFQALPDGSHLHDEDYSYFTVITGQSVCPTLFGISCTRQLKAAKLKTKDSEVTRSIVQKSVVVLTSTPHVFAHVKDKLTAVTQAYFSQLDFSDREILVQFHDALISRLKTVTVDSSLYTGMPVRQLLHDFRHRVLILLKLMLLEKRVIFFGTNVEQLCTAQYCILSLVPGLLERLKFCGDPAIGCPEISSIRQESLKSSDRVSVMRYMGMPLQPFSKGRFFGPYTPLQQVGLLEATHSYMIGTSNSLFLHAKDKHCDVLVNVDTLTIDVIDTDLHASLSLSTADRKWIDAIVATVEDSWDYRNPDIPDNRSFTGSEESIRNLFENYIYAMCSVVRYEQYLMRRAKALRPPSPESLAEIELDNQILDYGPAFLSQWSKTDNFRVWNKACDAECFDVFEPRHPVVQRNLTVADVQARISVAVQDLKLEERTAQTKAALGRTWASGAVKFNKFLNDAAANAEALRTSHSKNGSKESSQSETDEGPQTNGSSSVLQLPRNELNLAKSYFVGLNKWARNLASSPTDDAEKVNSQSDTNTTASKHSTAEDERDEPIPRTH